jgi:Tfp pilus assembly protein PilV
MKTKTKGIRNGAGEDRGNLTSGFSLIDLTVASALMAILVLGLGQILLFSRLSAFHSDSRLQSAILASRQLETLRSKSYTDVDLKNGGTFDVIQPDGLGRPYMVRWTVSEEFPELKAVSLQCYPAGRPERAVGFFLYLPQRLGF